MRFALAIAVAALIAPHAAQANVIWTLNDVAFAYNGNRIPAGTASGTFTTDDQGIALTGAVATTTFPAGQGLTLFPGITFQTVSGSVAPFVFNNPSIFPIVPQVTISASRLRFVTPASNIGLIYYLDLAFAQPLTTAGGTIPILLTALPAVNQFGQLTSVVPSEGANDGSQTRVITGGSVSARAGTAVPEPATAGVLAFALAAAVYQRTRKRLA